MNRRITATTVGLVLLAGQAVAQEKSLEEQLVGTWLIATADNIRADGSRLWTVSFTSTLRAAHGLTSMASITNGLSRRSRTTS